MLSLFVFIIIVKNTNSGIIREICKWCIFKGTDGDTDIVISYYLIFFFILSLSLFLK